MEKNINSLLNQNYSDFEVILVNDGSTDNSGEICSYYSKNNPNIVLIEQENGGLPSARNKGLTIAQGEYVMFVDSDDWVDQSYISYMVKCIKDVDFNTVLDAFGGSGMASYLFKHMGKQVTYNDLFRFNYLIGQSIIENERVLLTDKDVDFFLIHQANKLIVDRLVKKLKLPVEKVPYNLQEFGNLGGASILMLMTS